MFFLIEKLKNYLKIKKLPTGSRIEAKFAIGHGTRISGPIIIKGKGLCSIGKYCAIGDGTRIILSNHRTNTVNLQISLQQRIGGDDLIDNRQGVSVGNNVWIGDSVTILPGVSVGDGAVLAAGAVVVKDCDPFSVVGGVPAKFLKHRFKPEIGKELLEIEWWNWDENKMRRNVKFFNMDLNQFEGSLFDLIEP